MTTSVQTIDTNNYAAMAKAMGIANETTTKPKTSTLARLRLNHSPIMGTADVNGKTVNMEVVSGGTYKLDIPDVGTFYAPTIELRPYLQRYMYKKFVMGSGGTSNRYVKTVMADSLNVDLKDNDGGFNCGKPAGYIKDFRALPEKTQELIKQIKRVRVVLGTVKMIGAMDEKGNPVELDETAIIWEVENRDAFKSVGDLFASLGKQKRLPVQHMIKASSEERKLPNGNSFYLPVVSLDLTNALELSQEDQDRFGDFMSWVQNYNEYIIKMWTEKSVAKHDAEEDVDFVDSIVDIELDEEVA